MPKEVQSMAVIQAISTRFINHMKPGYRDVQLFLCAGSSMQGLVGETFFLDEFAFRQFDGGQAAQLDISKEAFVARVHQLYCKVESPAQRFSLSHRLALHFRELLQGLSREEHDH